MEKCLMRLDWFCGNAVSAPYWQMQGDWVYEPDECGCEFSTFHTQKEIDEGVDVKCPECGAEMNIDFDVPEMQILE